MRPKVKTTRRQAARRDCNRAADHCYVGAYPIESGRWAVGIACGKSIVIIGKPTTHANAEKAAKTFVRDIDPRAFLWLCRGAMSRGVPYEVRPEQLYPPAQLPPKLPPSKIPVTC